MVVIVREGESLDLAWRRFVREMVSNGVFVEYKKREYYVPPSVVKAERVRYYSKIKRRRGQAKRRLRSKSQEL